MLFDFSMSLYATRRSQSFNVLAILHTTHFFKSICLFKNLKAPTSNLKTSNFEPTRNGRLKTQSAYSRSQPLNLSILTN